MSTIYRFLWQNKGVVRYVNAKTKVAHKIDADDGQTDIGYFESLSEGVTGSYVNIKFLGAKCTNRGAVCGDQILRTVIRLIESTRWYYTDFSACVKKRMLEQGS